MPRDHPHPGPPRTPPPPVRGAHSSDVCCHRKLADCRTPLEPQPRGRVWRLRVGLLGGQRSFLVTAEGSSVMWTDPSLLIHLPGDEPYVFSVFD